MVVGHPAKVAANAMDPIKWSNVQPAVSSAHSQNIDLCDHFSFKYFNQASRTFICIYISPMDTNLNPELTPKDQRKSIAKIPGR